MKVKAACEIGIDAQHIQLPKCTTEAEVSEFEFCRN